ncbi:MAG: hypothetical protein K2W95_27810 [Candidatus Obscuribacterales bacterium]|nr:hypothetical protein [Candidatus Obscuribacterales bacterium]
MTSEGPSEQKTRWSFRWLFGLAALPVVLLLLAYFCIDSLLSDMCGNKVVSEVVSPDGQLKAVIFTRDCGATTDYSTHVSILNASDQLRNDGGNAFAMDEGELDLRWTGNRTLVLGHKSGEREYRSEKEVHVPGLLFWQKVEIGYERALGNVPR